MVAAAITTGAFTTRDLFTLLALLCYSGEIVASYTFVIENYSVVKGNVLGHYKVFSLGECSLRCLERVDCAGFNYFITSDEKAHCLLVGSSKAASDAKLPIPEAVLYGAKKILLKDYGRKSRKDYMLWCDNEVHVVGFTEEQRRERMVSWSSHELLKKDVCLLEKLSNLETRNKGIVFETTTGNTTEQCLNMCLDSADCRAAQFNRRTTACDLLMASPNTVYNIRNHFSYSEDVDIYENNCVEGKQIKFSSR
ncbi:PAN domain protein, partial [Ostertagia ostertagi]